ncbi:MAG: hypothetical protein KatS3mg129_1707 [Leptospiraceae bacterium]|nr:MAG: hypothetical protein KatS3mg129_1707 [Leptospiraceae bacterium]
MKKLFLLLLFLINHFIYSLDFKEYKYKITWFNITIGYAYIGVYGIINYQNEPCYILQTTAYNTKFLQTFYPVNDRIISYWSINKKIPYYSEKKLSEGNYYRFQKSYFYYELNEVHWFQKEYSGNIKNRVNRWKYKTGKTQLIPNTQDILSAIFFNKVSKKQPYTGAKFSIPLFDDNQLTNLIISITKKEKIKLTINYKSQEKIAWIIKPYYKTSGLFRLAGDLTLWVSDDSNRDILKMKAKIPYVGSINVELIEIIEKN